MFFLRASTIISLRDSSMAAISRSMARHFGGLLLTLLPPLFLIGEGHTRILFPPRIGAGKGRPDKSVIAADYDTARFAADDLFDFLDAVCAIRKQETILGLRPWTTGADYAYITHDATN